MFYLFLKKNIYRIEMYIFYISVNYFLLISGIRFWEVIDYIIKMFSI